MGAGALGVGVLSADLSRWLDTVVCGDAVETLRLLPDGCAALAIVDGPYNMRKADWDKFDSWDAFREWYRPIWEQLSRVLRDNCSLYVFGTFESLAALKTDLDAMGGGWRFGSAITLNKGPVWKQVSNSQARTWPSCAEYLMAYHRERVDISALAWDGVTRDDNTIRAYLNAERERAGVSVRELKECWMYEKSNKSEMPRHWFETAQWELPTRDNYYWIRDFFNERGNGTGPYLARPWEDLRREYEDLRYTFNPQQGVTDVWDVPICAGAERVKVNGKTAHVAQKPLAIMRRIIEASSNEGDTVVVPCSGLGSAEVACIETGRHFIGIERDAGYCAIAEQRIAAARRAHQPALDLQEATAE